MNSKSAKIWIDLIYIYISYAYVKYVAILTGLEYEGILTWKPQSSHIRNFSGIFFLVVN